jgi:hypothetical protein
MKYCYIFAAATENKNSSRVHECLTEDDVRMSIRELLVSNHPIESIRRVDIDKTTTASVTFTKTQIDEMR